MTLYAVDWSAKDEQRLMEAMEEFRFCNWEYFCYSFIIKEHLQLCGQAREAVCGSLFSLLSQEYEACS